MNTSTTPATTPLRKAVRGRYAPSPTGRLHLGNLRTALLAWLQTRAAGGTFVLRVEDVDHGRCRPHFEAAMLSDLRWLGLDWDEGPDVGGAFGPYRQSECGDRYARAAAQLETFACSCTRKEVRAAAQAPDGHEAVYPGTCRDGVAVPGRPTSMRWRAPQGVVAARDALLGAQHEDLTRDIGDFHLRRADGAWAYPLAVVVDDGHMQITDVLRGADLWTSTPRQVALGEALGLGIPRFAHVPLLLGPDGHKLSKRHGAPDIEALREGGARPGAVVAWMARTVGLVDASVGEVSPSELIAGFDVQSLVSVREPLLKHPAPSGDA